MTENNYKPKGGVVAAELYPVAELHDVESLERGGGIGVEIVDDGSSYEELFVAKEGMVSVEHTLTLCASRPDAEAWLDADFVQRCAVEGVVARVEMATGEELLIGWSKRFGFEQALRLEQLHFSSGSEPNFAPRVCLKLGSHDVQSALVSSKIKT